MLAVKQMMCIHTLYLYAYIHIYTHPTYTVYTHVCMHAYTHTYIYMHPYIHTCMLVCLHTGPGNTGKNYEMGGTILSKTVINGERLRGINEC